MDLSKARYESPAVKPDQYPSGSIPEIALVGRSNVGKSTIINTLLNRRGIARVSSEPGKTRGINFYNIDDKLYFVDLPGYGYAKVSKEEKARWGKMIETYLNSRRQLEMAVLLVDIRHAPTGDDVMMYKWITGRGLRRLVIATKTDKISRGQIHGKLQDIRKVLGLTQEDKVIAYSSETRQGKDDIWAAIRAGISEKINADSVDSADSADRNAHIDDNDAANGSDDAN